MDTPAPKLSEALRLKLLDRYGLHIVGSVTNPLVLCSDLDTNLSARPISDLTSDPKMVAICLTILSSVSAELNTAISEVANLKREIRDLGEQYTCQLIGTTLVSEGPTFERYDVFRQVLSAWYYSRAFENPRDFHKFPVETRCRKMIIRHNFVMEMEPDQATSGILYLGKREVSAVMRVVIEFIRRFEPEARTRLAEYLKRDAYRLDDSGNTRVQIPVRFCPVNVWIEENPETVGNELYDPCFDLLDSTYSRIFDNTAFQLYLTTRSPDTILSPKTKFTYLGVHSAVNYLTTKDRPIGDTELAELFGCAAKNK